MTRWEPNASGRLQQAALELYRERGYDQTTVTEIAKRAGLTERTFFRYFADKREVLFHGAGLLQERLVQGIEAAPDGLPPLDVVGWTLEAAAGPIEEIREFSRRRQAIIIANPELRERELIKLATLSAALADALRRRGVADPAASLAAEAGIAVFKIAFQRWVDQTGDPGNADGQTLVHLIRQSLAELKAIATV
ncbi:MAG TPA: TetR family transcriptional regulator [Trebonia sp.]|jgi:AcrR family transcriptional regulator